jgi:hypothetical protein
MAKLKGKIIKLGGSYAIVVPKALVDAEVVKNGQYLELDLPEPESLENSKLYKQFSFVPSIFDIHSIVCAEGLLG